jgi:hypothetical protein
MNERLHSRRALLRFGTEGRMPATTIKAPRRQLNPGLRERVRHAKQNGLPMWRLTIVAGFRHQSELSKLLHRPAVPVTSTNVMRLQRMANAVGWPVDDIFVPEDEATEVAS